MWSHTTTACGVSPFGNPGLNARLSAPPGLSQIPTSFIGSCYQGIHHAPFNTYTSVQDTRHQQPKKGPLTPWLKNKRCSRPLCSSQTTTPAPITTNHPEQTRLHSQQLPEAQGHITQAYCPRTQQRTKHHTKTPNHQFPTLTHSEKAYSRKVRCQA